LAENPRFNLRELEAKMWRLFGNCVDCPVHDFRIAVQHGLSIKVDLGSRKVEYSIDDPCLEIVVPEGSDPVEVVRWVEKVWNRKIEIKH